jgi:membrane-bound lytic murein transglycosylase B
VQAALAADRGEKLWNDTDFGVQGLFGGNRAAFDEAVEELRKQAQKAGVEEDLQDPRLEGTAPLAVLEAIDKIREKPAATTAAAWLDVIMTVVQWYKENKKDVSEIIDQFKSLKDKGAKDD